MFNGIALFSHAYILPYLLPCEYGFLHFLGAQTSDLTDTQWETIKPLFSGMREYTWTKRELMDAVLYFVKAGCQWRHLPHDFPPYSTVYSFYRRAQKSGLWDTILEHMVEKTRKNACRSADPTYALIDSQSVKTVTASEERGIDGGKKRKVANGIS